MQRMYSTRVVWQVVVWIVVNMFNKLLLKEDRLAVLLEGKPQSVLELNPARVRFRFVSCGVVRWIIL